jgi:TonB family protein
MSVLTLDNIVAHAVQAALLAVLGAIAAKLIRVDSAAVRYGYWRALLATCLLLPWLTVTMPATTDTPPTASVESSTTAATPLIDTPVRALSASTNWLPVLTTILFAGVAVRLLWVGAGVVSLRRLRGLGSAANDDEDIRELQAMLRTNADVRYVAGLRQPATFGLRRPVVLLPDTIREEEASIRRALVSHELFHVQRRDWAWVVCEEAVLAVLWFNPTMWWLVARVRLAREEAVDELAVLATGSRRTYVRALLAFAEDAPLAPAPAFAHRRHLFHRITLISKEGAMSSFRIVFSCAVMALVLSSGAWLAAEAFPLIAVNDTQEVREQPGPMEQRAKPVTADNPIPRRTDYRAADYPDAARALGVAGSVTLRATLDEVGRVAETRRLSFSLESTNPRISMSFSHTSQAAVAEAIERSGRGTADTQGILRAIDALAQSAASAVSQWRYEAPANGPLSFDVKVYFKPDGETSAMQSISVPPPSTAKSVVGVVNADGAVRVGGGIMAPRKVVDVAPVYPPIAMSARVSGMVIVEARIGTDGTVEDVKVLRSIPLLDQAAVDAVRQWRFTPTLLNGVRVPVIMTMTVNFTLQ